MAGIFGVFERSDISNSLDNYINDLADECLLPQTKSKVTRVFANGYTFAMVLPEKDKLHYLSYQEEKGFIAVYGYVWPGFNKFEDYINEALSNENGSLDKFMNAIRVVDGSFVIVVLDNKKERLYIVTDRFGTRPIYYTITDAGIVYSTRIRPLLRYLKSRRVPIEIDGKNIVSYLWFGKIGILGNTTLIKNIYIAPPASVLVYDLRGNSIHIVQYWDLEYSCKISDEEIALRQIYKSLVRAIIKIYEILRKNNIVKVCLELSGGLDSRTIGALLSLLHKLGYRFELKAITFGSPRCDELVLSRLLTKKLEISHVVGTTNPDSLVTYAKKVVKMSDGFDTINKAHVLFGMEMLYRNDCEAFVTGFMLDLLLGGSFMSRNIMNIKTDSEFLSQLYEKSRVFTHEELLELLSNTMKPKLIEVLETFKQIALNTIVATRNFADANDRFFIYTRVRRYTIYGSVIQRNVASELLPTIDIDVISSITSIHPKLRHKYRIYRKLLCNMNKRMALVPYQKTWIPPLFPRSLWNLGYIFKRLNNMLYRFTRGKVGFETIYFDYSKAIRESPPWKRLVIKTLSSDNAMIYKLGFVKRDYVAKILYEHLNGLKDHSEKLIFLVSLELYLQDVSEFI